MLRLGRGIRIQFENSTKSHILLFPEGIVDLNLSAYSILSRLPKKKAELHAELCKETNSVPPLEGFEEFIETAKISKWIVDT